MAGRKQRSDLTGSEPGPVRWQARYSAGPEAVSEARNEASGVVSRHVQSGNGRSESDVSDLVDRIRSVLSELCTNAVEAAPGQWFEVEVALTDDGVRCVVTNPGYLGALRPPGRLPEDDGALAARGRGLQIVEHLSNGVTVRQVGDRVVATATLTTDPQPIDRGPGRGAGPRGNIDVDR